MSGPERMDLTGKKFGRLTVVSRVVPTPEKGHAWVCKCECGGTKTVFQSKLRQGNVKSCGCLRRDFLDGIKKTDWRRRARRK